MADNFFKRLFKPTAKAITKTPTADFSAAANGSYSHLLSVSYSGEKNLGEMGPAIDYRLDYDLLRVRSWQSQLESDVCKTIIKRYVAWVIGRGLKLQCEPEENVLLSEGIKIDKQKFSDLVEARFNLYKKTKRSDYAEMKSIDKIAATAFKNAIVGGDVLVIQRFDGENVTVQLIDGVHVQSPMYGSEWYPTALANGSSVINGVEIDEKGKHVAYYVRIYAANKTFLRYDRIEARSRETGLQVAFLIYGSEHRLNNVRGLPLLAACLETAKKMERYKEATLGSAEEVAKFVYQVVHENFSDGSNPLGDRLAEASGFELDKPEMTRDAAGNKVAAQVAASTNKQAINMPIGAELKPVTYQGTLSFKEFYEVNTDLLCATVGIPPNVAMSKYNDSFSASRAAIKDWEHTLHIERDDFAFQYYDNIYSFWLEIQILQNKIQAPGYLMAKKTNNSMVLAAYRKTRWVGSQVPHIDPEKEVRAERLKLGETASAIPLTTVEASTEALNGGESMANMTQYSQELETSKKLGIEVPLPPAPIAPVNVNVGKKKKPVTK